MVILGSHVLHYIFVIPWTVNLFEFRGAHKVVVFVVVVRSLAESVAQTRQDHVLYVSDKKTSGDDKQGGRLVCYRLRTWILIPQCNWLFNYEVLLRYTILSCSLFSAYSQQRSKLRKKNDAEKKTLKEALSNYNNIVVYCDASEGYVPVDEDSVLSGNVAWDSSEGFTLFQIPYVRFFFRGVGERLLINPVCVYFINFIYLFVWFLNRFFYDIFPSFVSFLSLAFVYSFTMSFTFNRTF